MSVSESITGHIIDVIEEDISVDCENKQCRIKLWCLSKESEPFVVEVQNFRPWMYIELPAGKIWNQRDATEIVDSIQQFTGGLRLSGCWEIVR